MASLEKTHPFTCNTCQVAFKSSDLQRSHMQSDWHRYNLKRRVASLPPISSEVFAEKVLATKADAAATAAKASFQKHCEACQRSYYSENAYTNHLGSQKHKANALRLQSREADAQSIMSSTFSLGQPPSTADNVDEEAEEEFVKVMHSMKAAKLTDNDGASNTHPSGSRDDATGEDEASEADSKPSKSGDIPKEVALTSCLFCNIVAPNLDENLTHMFKTHGLFIPERQYLADLEGLVVYLNKKVYDRYQCLYCNRLKWSEDGIKTHMRDTGHCKIAYDTEDQQLEIGDFYDFRSTYSDGEDDDIPELNHSTSGDNTAEDDGWETSSSASSVPTEELGKLYCDTDRNELHERLRQHRHHSHANPAKHHTADGWHSHAHAAPHAVYHDDFELLLPSGRIAGHRSLNRFFRQNLHKYPSAAERAAQLYIRDTSDDEERRGRRGRDQKAVTRANGGLGMLAVSESKKREVKALERRFRVREERYASLKKWRAEKTANHQKHYRDPLLQ